MGKLRNPIFSLLSPPNYMRALVQHRYSVLLPVVAGLVLVACSGAAVSGQGAPQEAPVPSVATQFDGLDAQAIVAAQEQVVVGIYDRLLPSVVEIRATTEVRQSESSPRLPDLPDLPFDGLPDIPDGPDGLFQRSGGSGFVWDDQGRIVTNHHVVDGADRITVIFADGTELKAEVLGSDPDSDLAVLQVKIPEGSVLPNVDLADSGAVKVGQLAVAIGNPFGQEFTITSGIVSAVGRTIRSGNSQFSIPEVIQTDAPINPGNSGGPLLDRQGRVIGVNTQIISRSGANSGIGFAVPINTAKRVVPALIEHGHYEYAWLGISGTTLTPDVAEMMDLPRDTRGALVIDVNVDGPAEKYGLQGSDRSQRLEGVEYRLGGDIIVAIDDAAIQNIDDLIVYLVDNSRPDDGTVLEVIRGEGGREKIKVKLAQRPRL